MTVIRTRGRENRRDRRRPTPLTLDYDGHEFEVVDCSLGGLSIAGGAALFLEIDAITALLRIPRADDTTTDIEMPLKVTRVDLQPERAAFLYAQLSDASFTALENHLTGRDRRHA